MASTPTYEKFGDGRARLLLPFRFSIDGEDYFIPRGFEWDGASIPHLLRWKYGDPFDPVHRVGGLIHDAIYSNMVLLVPAGAAEFRGNLHAGVFAHAFFERPEADAIYRNCIRANGCPWWQSWKEWAGVRIFGASHWYD